MNHARDIYGVFACSFAASTDNGVPPAGPHNSNAHSKEAPLSCQDQFNGNTGEKGEGVNGRRGSHRILEGQRRTARGGVSPAEMSRQVLAGPNLPGVGARKQKDEVGAPEPPYTPAPGRRTLRGIIPWKAGRGESGAPVRRPAFTRAHGGAR